MAVVELGSDVTTVGQEARVGLTLDPRGEDVAAVEDEVVFPAALSFVEGETGDAGKSASATIEVKLAGTADAEGKRTLHVTIRAPEGKALRAGTLAVLRFKAPEAVEGESTDVKLSHRPVLFVGGARREIASQEGGGVVTVLKKPLAVIACFFYMH